MNKNVELAHRVMQGHTIIEEPGWKVCNNLSSTIHVTISEVVPLKPFAVRWGDDPVEIVYASDHEDAAYEAGEQRAFGTNKVQTRVEVWALGIPDLIAHMQPHASSRTEWVEKGVRDE